MSKIVVKWKIFIREDGVLVPFNNSKVYTTIGYTFYENIQYKIAKLNKVEILLFHFLCENMDCSNNIVHTKSLRSFFISHAKKNLGLSYKDETIKKAFGKLVKVGLIINYDVRCDFTVNPRHVFKSTQKRRKEVIQGIIYSLVASKKTKSNFKTALGIYDKKWED